MKRDQFDSLSPVVLVVWKHKLNRKENADEYKREIID